MTVKRKCLFLDINHPAHVHFLKHIYWDLKEKYKIVVTASDKPLVYHLLNQYGIPFVKMGSYGRTIWSKGFMLIVLNIKMMLLALKHKPELIIGIVSIRGAQIGWLLNIKSFVFTDTEHAAKQIALFRPFAYRIYTPINFPNDLGSKHIRYNGYHELAYLGKNRFTPNQKILSEFGLNREEQIIIIRLVAWDATHDNGTQGFTLENKRLVIKLFNTFGQVLITSENPLPKEFEKYRITVPPDKIHDIMCFASLIFGESATMVTEGALLGVPGVYIDNAGRCYTKELEEKYKIVFNYKQDELGQQQAIEKALSLLETDKERFQQIKERIHQEKLLTTDFLLNQIENEI